MQTLCSLEHQKHSSDPSPASLQVIRSLTFIMTGCPSCSLVGFPILLSFIGRWACQRGNMGYISCPFPLCSMLNKWELVQNLLWQDALPVANQQESLAGPHLFCNHWDSRTGSSLSLYQLSDASIQYKWPTDWCNWHHRVITTNCTNYGIAVNYMMCIWPSLSSTSSLVAMSSSRATSWGVLADDARPMAQTALAELVKNARTFVTMSSPLNRLNSLKYYTYKTKVITLVVQVMNCILVHKVTYS